MIKRIMLDTDIGTDSDDIGALCVLHNLRRQDKIEILSITSCVSSVDSLRTIDVINRYFQNPVLIGMNKRTELCSTAEYNIYARAISMAYPSEINEKNSREAVSVMRSALAESSGKVTLITIGNLNNVAALLKSGADQASPLSGKELVKQKIEAMYIMGGCFNGALQAEYNIQLDIASAQMVVNEMPCEIVFSPFEVGIQVLSGRAILNGKNNPLKFGYYVHNITARPSWDPITVYCACVTQNIFSYSVYGTVEIACSGETIFREGKGKMRIILPMFDKAAAENALEDWMKTE